MSRIAVSLSVAAGYSLFYLVVIGDLRLRPEPQWQWILVEQPWQRLIDMRSLFLFEPVALLQAGSVVWLLSPLNMAVAGVLAVLLALNVNLALLERQHPVCRTGGRQSWLVGAVPALLSGGACCAPGLVLLLGLPGLGAFAGLFQWLLPLSLLMLIANWRWQLHRRADAGIGHF